MPSDPLQTADLRKWLARIHAGDRDAKNDLLRACQDRLEHLIRKMLRRYPTVARWTDTGDVFTGSALRLLRALEATDVADTRAFFNLAAAIIRRELIDLSRHFCGPQGLGANHASQAASSSRSPQLDPPDEAMNPTELERWTALHEAVEKLPVEEREAFSLTFYHGWSQQQIAELMGVDERTVRRRLRSAEVRLHRDLEGHLPDTGDPS